MTMISMIVLAVDLLIPLTVLSVGWTLMQARQTGPSAMAVFVVLSLSLLWGAAWSWLPPLSQTRFLPPPAGQAGAILGLVVVLNGLRFFPSVSLMFQSIDQNRLLELGMWRVIYGVALLAIGLLGGLPPAFFWSAAAGDIAVGIWAITLIMRRPAISTHEVMAWNVVGLLDLVHVLFLGAIHLRGFYLAHPEIMPLNLLPLVGVPLLLVVHVQSLIGLRSQSEKAVADLK